MRQKVRIIMWLRVQRNGGQAYQVWTACLACHESVVAVSAARDICVICMPGLAKNRILAARRVLYYLITVITE